MKLQSPKQSSTLAGLLAALSMAAPPVAAAPNGVLAPICANGVISYVLLDLDGEKDDFPRKGACHGICAPARKATVKGKSPLRR